MWASDIAGVCWCYERKVEEAQGVHKLGEPRRCKQRECCVGTVEECLWGCGPKPGIAYVYEAQAKVISPCY